MIEFKRTTNCNKKYPTEKKLEPYFIGNGSIPDYKTDDDDVVYITVDKCHLFFEWFISMCDIIKELRMIYEFDDEALFGLFYELYHNYLIYSSNIQYTSQLFNIIYNYSI